MKRSVRLALCLCLFAVSITQAAITITGNVEPDDPSTWTTSTADYVGNASEGSLAIDGGSTISSSGTGFIGYEAGVTGLVTISGAGSAWNGGGRAPLYLGYDGAGELSIIDGGLLDFVYLYLGHNVGSTGTTMVSGADSILSSMQLSVGASGVGELNIADGGSVTASGGIATNVGSSGIVTVSGAGSQWIASTLNVGVSGTGELNITDGGVVSSSYVSSLGSGSGSTGVATISGTESIWQCQQLYVGQKGAGELNVFNGGTVSVTDTTWVASESGSSGAINFDNGTLNTDTFYAESSQLSGTGTINTSGLILDGMDLCFDSTHGSQQTLFLNDQNQNLTINLDCSSSENMGAGYTGNSSLTVREGFSLNSNFGYLGYVPGATGIATISGTGSTWNSGVSNVGYYGAGEIGITDGGTMIAGVCYLGRYSGSTGTALVSGSNSTWDSSYLYVGYGGAGVLNIVDHGTVDADASTYVAFSPNSSGTIHFDNGTLNTGFLYADASQLTGTGTINASGLALDGVEMFFDATHGFAQTILLNGQGQNVTVNFEHDTADNLYTGYRGNGTLTVRDGFVAECYSSYVGYKSGSVGTVNVLGSGSVWDNTGTLNVGYEGTGVLNVSDAGKVNCEFSFIGSEFGSMGTVNVSGAGSVWNNKYRIRVGYEGTGILNITDAGVVDSSYGYLGFLTNSKGTVNVSGIGSKWINEENIYVGYYGSGELNVRNGGKVISSGSPNYIGYDRPLHKSKVNVSGFGSSWICNNTLYVGYEGNAELNVTDGGFVSNVGGCIADDGTSTGIVYVSGVGSIWENRYHLYVGKEGDGELNITNGGLTKAFRLTIDSDEDGDSFINMSTGGMLALKGEADDSLAAFLDLVLGADAIRWWDTSIHDWALLTTAELGTDYTLEYLTEGDLAGYTLLTVETVRVPGDANSDGRVDGSDVTILASNWQQGVGIPEKAPWEIGDFNEDGIVDGSDVTILAGNWQYGVEATSTAVPEPSGVALLLTAMLAAGLVPALKARDGKRRR